ncbi:hypothetical protein KEU06_24350 [Pseudaminobacter sp. 19-2017]|uniref:Uncharacterized protein n=1 Tax=Pseudaminobacter soli (ex Zhang et al. 2022) TaxID=2831468 RepID=A0A942I3S8_9HYPH|nr:hypothetical protein [Pseudaminobacter soli]MBS3651752.1 hypothetical protein [Pseudaminobacter soli]
MNWRSNAQLRASGVRWWLIAVHKMAGEHRNVIGPKSLSHNDNSSVSRQLKAV